MNVLFSMRHHGYLRNYESTIRLLLQRGHSVRVLFAVQKPVPLAARLAADHAGFSYDYAPMGRGDGWDRVGQNVRDAGNYLRYLEPVYLGCGRLRQRAEQRAPAAVLRLARLPLLRSRLALTCFSAALKAMERSIPSSRTIESLLRSEQADVLLVTPLVDIRPFQVDYIKAARAMGLPTALCVNSWDNLTNKGLIWEIPDRVFVWNHVQKREATELHGVPPERVVVTGAQAYDHWFEQQPSTSREQFACKTGLPPDRPFVLYLCSSLFVAPDERTFVERWIRQIRAARDPELRSAGILVRPHAGNAEQWRGYDLASYENVVVWPPLGASPIDDRSRADYYDSMFHSAAVVGINTSALIEAGIVGRSVHTVLDPEFAETQEGTLHFHYLVHANGGLLRVARDFEEHLSQLSATLRATEAPDHKRLSFLEAFVRPHGLDTPATPILVDAVERLHAAGPFRVKRQPLWLLPLRSMLWLVGLWLRGREAVRGARAAVTGQRLRAVGGASTSEGRSRLSILFVMKHPGYVRNFESVLRLLAERGHQIHLAFQKEQRENQQVLGQTKLVEMLCRQYANVSRGPAPGPDAGIWSAPREALRRAVNYLRYLEPRYRESPRLRERAELRAPRLVRRLSNWPPLRTGWGVWLLSRALRLLEQAIPPSRGVEVFLRERQPDIVVITPLVELGASQADLVRAARRLGIRSGLCVHSWDNLTNKGLMPDVPDIVTVWNEAQKREAVELHRVPADRVVVTGAVSYDHWFDWSPSRGRREFCQHVGLRADRPFLLYVCSSPFIAADEASFVRQWVSKIRTRAGARLGDVGVLIRPHPQNAAQWLEVGLSDLPEVAIWPRAGADPVTAEAKADYYDSIYHCAAVVGVNTSALIEAAIVGRPVYTLLAPEFRDSQEGTLHFHHLLRESDGLLRVARSYDEHAAQLAEAVMGNQSGHERDRRFLEAFIRPSGLGIAAGPRLVAAIEAACARPAPRPSCPPLWASALRVSLTPVVRKLYAQRCEQAHHRSPPPPLVTQRAEPERSEADRLGVRLTAGHGQER